MAPIWLEGKLHRILWYLFHIFHAAWNSNISYLIDIINTYCYLKCFGTFFGTIVVWNFNLGCFYWRWYDEDLALMERRSGKDRRKNQIPEVKSLFLYGRRKGTRRKEDKYRLFFFDQYNSKLIIAVIVLLFLSLIDAMLTLFLIDNGAKEINPIMAYFLEFGPYTFLGVKYFLTCYAALVLLIFQNFFIRKLKISYTIAVFVMPLGPF